MTQMLRDVVQMQGGFKPSVQLPDDFFREEDNRHFIESYIPTRETLEIFIRIKDSLQPNAEKRAKLFTGTYGTGKSDLMLMIANYVMRSSNDPLLKPFFERLRNLDSHKADIIYQARLGKPPFLLVLLQADTATTFSGFVLRGLEEALAKVGRQDVLGTTYYRAALDQIVDWEQRLPDNIERLKKELQVAHGMTLAQLKSNLESSQTDVALDIFKAATLKAIGLPFQPATVIERPHEAFAAAAKQLVASGEFSGIFVIADEFTYLLRKLAESETPDTKAIDSLAEAAERSGNNQIHFYIVSLEGFSSAQANTRTAQVALERTGGRFIQGLEELGAQDMVELISAAIVKSIPIEKLFANAATQQDELLSLTMNLWGGRFTGRPDREWLRKTIVQGCFPLHPLVTYCLPLLNRRLAQNERTMFNFLWDEQRGLTAFINTTAFATADGWVNLLSLHELFSYFEINLRESRSELDLFYQQARSKLSPQQVNEGLEGRLLHALILLDVASGDPHLRADRNLLLHALGLPSSQSALLDAALNELEEAGIAYPTQAGYYQLVKQGQANPRELRNAIKRGVQKITGSPVVILNEEHMLNPLKAAKYNSERGTERELTAIFVSTDQLVNTTSLNQELQGRDGLAWYVLARTDEERQQSRSAAIQLTSQCDQLVVAIPYAPTDLVDRWRLKRSMENLRRSLDYSRPDYQELLADSGSVGKDYLTEFGRERQKFDDCAKLEWYYQGRTIFIPMPAQLEELASRVMRTVFPKTPAHKTAQHLAQNSRSISKLREALDEILKAPFKRSGKKSPVDAILMNGAGELGLIYFIGQDGGYSTYDVCSPDARDTRLRNSKMVWDILDQRLRNTFVSWSDIVDELKSRPYGLSSPVLQLFLAAFLRFNRGYIEVYTAKNTLEAIGITGEEIRKIVESPKDYMILYKPLTSQQTAFLHSVTDMLSSNTGYRGRGEAGSLLDRTARLLAQKIKEIVIVSQQPSVDDLEEVLTDSSKEIIAICVCLIEAGHLNGELLKAALLETLPRRLDLPQDSADWTDESLEQAISTMSSAYKQLQQIPSRLRRSIMLQIGQWFELADPSKGERGVLEAAKKWRTEKVKRVQVRDLGTTPDAAELLKLLDDNPYSFEQVFLNTLPARWGVRPFEEWQALSTRKTYLNRLKRAKQVVEEIAAALARTPIEEAISTQPTVGASTLSENRVASSIQSAAINSKMPPIQEGSSKSATVAARLAERTQSIGIKQTSLPNSDGQKQAKVLPTERFEGRAQEEKTHVAEQPSALLSPQSPTASTVEQAFETIKAMFEQFSRAEQRRLWNLLVEEYDPR